MPKALEKQLRKQARKKGLTGVKRDAYIYGTLRRTGWKPSREKNLQNGNSQKKVSK